MNWNPEKNKRRCDLIDKEIDQCITEEERKELNQLQNEMEEYRKKVAPLPLDAVRRTKKELEKLAKENPPPQEWWDEEWLPFEQGEFNRENGNNG